MGLSLDFDVDLEKGILDCQNVYTKSPEKPLTHMSPDSKPVITGEETLGSLENHDATPVKCAISKPEWGRSERKKSASKPPRPPRGPSLDAADQKLMREIAELAMLKRARVERMRALKKLREAKAASSSSLGNVLATLLTAIFFFVLVFQGMVCFQTLAIAFAFWYRHFRLVLCVCFPKYFRIVAESSC